ncbi:complex I intermediate-associated protein 30, mitochondrial [Phlebotomus argentipes]|uniref:complex I intermediate-associated protein 30, mitochondrial n=1 Tax=Phlebotomus argentipes TaxID=94469 RepID=UPI0028932D3F|nr:complex I intermediate-associated protein 30, mitochondrial [Phlebotomus argentipes]
MLTRPHSILRQLYQSVRECASTRRLSGQQETTLRLRSEVGVKGSRCLHTSPVCRTTFYERDRKSSYNSTRPQLSRKERILQGLKELKSEIGVWREEVKEHFRSDPILLYRPGEVDVKFQFKESTDVEKWVCTVDSDHNEGYSKASFDVSPAGYGLFHGFLNSRVPIDGKIKRSGYANISSIRAQKSFKRNSFYNWQPYNMLVMRIRGDGRSYLINLATEGYFDVLWNDVYHFALYTRGGPYWQHVRIPFSKFFLASKGRVQDKQHAINLEYITRVGFTVDARHDSEGPFSLEIDYIGCENDPSHTEDFAYEMYKQDKYIVGT